MNYEALGRYTEAKEKAEKLAISLHNEMAGISRLVSPSGTSKLGQAKAYDFEAIKRQVASAELIGMRGKPRPSGRGRIARTPQVSPTLANAVSAVVRCTGE